VVLCTSSWVGAAHRFPEIVLADDDLEEVTGFLIEGAETDDNIGKVVKATNINGDMVADIVVTAPFRDQDSVIGTAAQPAPSCRNHRPQPK
jgi:hypothetical protein